MKGSWEVEDFAIAESEAILEIINAIADMDGDLSGWVETSDVRILNDGIMEKVKNKLWLKLCQAHVKDQFGFVNLNLHCIWVASKLHLDSI